MNDDDIVKKLKTIIPLGETRKVSDLARRLRVRRSVIEDAIQGSYAGLDLVVGVRCGNGYGTFKPSEYEVEHYE